MCLRVSLVPIISHYRGLTVFNGKPWYKARAIRWLLPGDCLRVFTLKNCSTELEYRLPPRDFHPSKPSHYLIPRLYFCCMLITAFYTPHTNLTSSSHTTQPVSSGFIEWASVITTLHDFSHRFGRHPIESSQSCHRQWAQRISSMDLQSFWLPSTTTSDVKISSFNEWTSFHITTLYTRFAFVLWRTRLPSTR